MKSEFDLAVLNGYWMWRDDLITNEVFLEFMNRMKNQEKKKKETDLINSEQRIEPIMMDYKINRMAETPMGKRFRRTKAEMQADKNITTKKKGVQKYPDEMKGFIERHMETNSNIQLSELINEKWDCDITPIRLNSYMTYNKLKRKNKIVKRRTNEEIGSGKKKLKGWAKYHADKKEKPKKDPYKLIINGKLVDRKIMEFIEERKNWTDYERLRDEIIMMFEQNFKIIEIKAMQGQFIKKKPVIKLEDDEE